MYEATRKEDICHDNVTNEIRARHAGTRRLTFLPRWDGRDWWVLGLDVEGGELGREVEVEVYVLRRERRMRAVRRSARKM